MSESNKQMQTPYPRGTGGGGVPVLFSLRNVQPKIVAGNTAISIAATPPAPSPSATDAPATRATKAMDAASQNGPSLTQSASSTPLANPPLPFPAKPLPKPNSNRLYNSVIATLVIVLCVLAFRNAKGRKSDTIANTTTSPTSLVATTTGPTSLLPPSPSKESTPSASLSTPSPLNLGPSCLSIPSLSTHSTEPSLLVSSQRTIDFPVSTEKNVDATAPVSGPLQSQTTAKPALTPSLLELSAPDEVRSDSGVTDNGSSTPERGSLGPNTPSLIGSQALSPTPEPSKTYSLQLPNQQSKASTGKSDTTATNTILDTNVPLTTRELISTYNNAKPNNVQPSQASSFVPATTVSNQNTARPTNPAPYTPLNENPQLMSGQAYPPLSKEYASLPVPAYEQISGMKAPSVPYQPINPGLTRQPNAGQPNAATMPNSNRYPGNFIQQPAAGSVPYIPYQQTSSPVSSGNSVGTPPSN